MKLSFMHFITNTISDLSEYVGLEHKYNMLDLRKRVNILVIDDNDFFELDFLRHNGYQITHKKDIDSIKDVEPYEIIMCDIGGVGKKLGYELEGATIIKEIKASYPIKQIIAYSSNTYNADYNKYFSIADDVVTKDISIDDWMSILDNNIRISINPIFVWEKIRSYYLEHNVSTLTIAKIEDKYVKAIKKKDYSILIGSINENEFDVKSILVDFTTSLCAKLILGKFGGI